jgi:hypothetical protein
MLDSKENTQGEAKETKEASTTATKAKRVKPVKEVKTFTSQPVDRAARQAEKAKKQAAAEAATDGYSKLGDYLGFDIKAYGDRCYENGVAIGRAQMLNEILAQEIANTEKSKALLARWSSVNV